MIVRILQKYQNIISLITTAVMLWNVVGWLGTGLIMNHTHHGDSTHCEISFCYCEIEEGEAICTCHHLTQNTSNHLKSHASDQDHDHHQNQPADVCYFTDGHTPSSSASQLVFETKLIGCSPNSSEIFYPSLDAPPYNLLSLLLLDGSSAKLLRPPQV